MGCVAVAPEGGPVQPTNPSAVQSKLRLQAYDNNAVEHPPSNDACSINLRNTSREAEGHDEVAMKPCPSVPQINRDPLSGKPNNSPKSVRSHCSSRKGKAGFGCSSKSRMGCQLDGKQDGPSSREKSRGLLTCNSSQLGHQESSGRLVRHFSHTSRMVFLEPDFRTKSKFGEAQAPDPTNIMTLTSNKPVKVFRKAVQKANEQLQLYRSHSKGSFSDFQQNGDKNNGLKYSRLKRVGSHGHVHHKRDNHDARISELMQIYGISNPR